MESIDYLNSPEALRSIEQDPYWPKWNSSWWHMVLLHEMGRPDLIPRKAAEALLLAMSKKYPAIYLEKDFPAGTDPFRDVSCFCAMGTMRLVMESLGLPFHGHLPWVRDWIIQYALPDGGLNCHPHYFAHPEPASSMVATVSVLESIIFSKLQPNSAEMRFVEKGIENLLTRELRLAYPGHHSNLEEKEDESDWLKLSFPRFYFYDILRGLNVVTAYSQRFKKTIPQDKIRWVQEYLHTKFPDGNLRIGRQAWKPVRTLKQNDSGEWNFPFPSEPFSLLEKVSRLGDISPALSRQWARIFESIR